MQRKLNISEEGRGGDGLDIHVVKWDRANEIRFFFQILKKYFQSSVIL